MSDPTDAKELVERLKTPRHSEGLMQHWDRWRKMHKDGFSGSATRDEFEALIDHIDEERAEAASLIEARDADIARATVEREAAITGAREAVLSMMWMPGVRAALDAIPTGQPYEPWVRKANEADRWEARALAAEAALAKAVAERTRVVRLYMDHDKMTNSQRITALINHPYFARTATQKEQDDED